MCDVCSSRDIFKVVVSLSLVLESDKNGFFGFIYQHVVQRWIGYEQCNCTQSRDYRKYEKVCQDVVDVAIRNNVIRSSL
jgi:hypothetical protein